MMIFKPDKTKVVATIILFVLVLVVFGIIAYERLYGVADLNSTPPRPHWSENLVLPALFLGLWTVRYVEHWPLPLAVLVGGIFILAYQYVAVCLIVGLFRRVLRKLA